MKNCESILGKKILEIREIKGISQQQLALKAGLSKALITHIETGKRYPSDKALQKIIKEGQSVLLLFILCIGIFFSPEHISDSQYL